MQQFTLVERAPLAEIKSKGESLVATSALHETTIGNSKVSATFDNATGRMTALAFGGKNIIVDGNGFLYDNHRWIENDRQGYDYYGPDSGKEHAQTRDGLDAKGEITVVEENGNTIVKTVRKGSICDTRIDYTIYPQGIIDVEATFVPKDGNLRRAGLICGLDSTLKNVNYKRSPAGGGHFIYIVKNGSSYTIEAFMPAVCWESSNTPIVVVEINLFR